MNGQVQDSRFASPRLRCMSSSRCMSPYSDVVVNLLKTCRWFLAVDALAAMHFAVDVFL